MLQFALRLTPTRCGTAAKYLGDSRASVTPGPDSDKPAEQEGVFKARAVVVRTLSGSFIAVFSLRF